MLLIEIFRLNPEIRTFEQSWFQRADEGAVKQVVNIHVLQGLFNEL